MPLLLHVRTTVAALSYEAIPSIPGVTHTQRKLALVCALENGVQTIHTLVYLSLPTCTGGTYIYTAADATDDLKEALPRVRHTALTHTSFDTILCLVRGQLVGSPLVVELRGGGGRSGKTVLTELIVRNNAKGSSHYMSCIFLNS
eukprot:GHVQ01006776.1.p1 GENE.GHVQ01006776.1~~GHVQ01006776.1.p1  ORF type:complete len:145 (+),score=8.10 GHVQ01006776.1:692-1126(+)